MRTTVSIDEKLLERAKRRAAERGMTLGGIVDEALREHLVAARSRDEVDLPVSSGGVPRKGIDLSSNRALYDALDDAGAPR